MIYRYMWYISRLTEETWKKGALEKRQGPSSVPLTTADAVCRLPAASLQWLGALNHHSGQTSAHVRTFLMTSCQAVRTTTTHTSYKQPLKPVSHSVLETNNFFSVKPKKRMVYQYVNKLCFRKVLGCSSPYFFSFLKQFLFSFSYFARSQLFRMYVFL